MIFLHTKWSDICICQCGCDYLVQGRKNKITGASSFRITPFKQILALAEISGMKQELLEKAGLWKIETPPKKES